MSYEKEFEKFIAAYPDYAKTEKLDELRANDYSRLDRLGHVYLDYTGEAIAGALAAFLRPELAKTVSAVASGNSTE